MGGGTGSRDRIPVAERRMIPRGLHPVGRAEAEREGERTIQSLFAPTGTPLCTNRGRLSPCLHGGTT